MNPADLSALELSQRFRRKELSPVETAIAVFARLDQWQPKINAFCYEDRARTLADARASEARWQAGKPLSVLDGVPISIKDLILTQGWPTRRGSRSIDVNQPWTDDAPSVARIREAGMVIIGKTTTPEFGIKGTTDNTLTGVTRNPWNTDRTPGGSSGGSAAAVAAGIGPLSVGTDGAGSVRIPAAFSGGFGLKPSFGRVPAWPLSPFGTVAHLGPHTRTVTDAAMLMNVISRPDARDWTSLPFDPRDYTVGLNDGIRGLRVAFSPALGYVKDVHPAVAAAVRKSAEKLAELGAQVEEVNPGFDNPLEITMKLWFIGSATLYNGMTPAQQALVDPALAAQAEIGGRVTVAELQALTKRRGELGIHMRKFHERFDLLVTPGVSVPAFKARASAEWDTPIANFLDWTPFSYPFNLTQQPACVCPCGFDAEGLPLSTQIVGPMHGDALVLRAARALESAQPWKLIATAGALIMADILSLGEPMWEMSAIPAEPGKYTLGFGGDTANFCVAAARQGASVGYITRVGDDPFGDALRELWTKEGIDCSQVTVDERASTGGYFVHHGPNGHSFSYARSGSAATRLAPDDIDMDAVERAQFVHSSGITQAISASARAATLSLFQHARETGVFTAFDSNLRTRLWTVGEAREALAEILPLTDYFFPSLEDATALSGTDDHDRIFQWAHELGAQVIVLKLGADGVAISQGQGADPIRMAAFPVATVDATGAGDCFAGATIARLVRGDLFLDAVRYGNAAAALTTTGYGAIGAIPHAAAVQAYLRTRA